MNTTSKILVLGARGLVGSALAEALSHAGYENILTPARGDLDLLNPTATEWYFSVYKPEYIFFAAAKVGGIAHNVADKVGFLADNLQMELNVIQNAAAYKCRKLLFIGTSCVYPRDCRQPMSEDQLFTGLLESTTEAYSIAKIAGIKLCDYYRREQGKNFITALPCNVFGPGDNFNEVTAHCLPGMMARMAHAKQRGDKTFSVWGSPETQREFIYSQDLANSLVAVMQRYEDAEPINVGSGHEMTMWELALNLKRLIGYQGEIVFDASKPAGAPRKLLDNSKLDAICPIPLIGFRKGLAETWKWFKNSELTLR